MRQLARLDDVPSGGPFADAITGMRLVAADLISFTGVDPDHAHAVVRDATGELDIPTPPATRRAPFLRGGREPPDGGDTGGS